MVPALMENAAANMAGVEQALSIAMAHLEVALRGAGEMEQFVLLVLLVMNVAMKQHFGQITTLCMHVAKCHAGEVAHIAWPDRPAIAAAMDLIGIGGRGMNTVTKGKGDYWAGQYKIIGLVNTTVHQCK